MKIIERRTGSKLRFHSDNCRKDNTRGSENTQSLCVIGALGILNNFEILRSSWSFGESTTAPLKDLK